MLPPVLVASVMVVIGVGLSATAVDMAFMQDLPDGTSAFYGMGAIVAAITLVAAVVFSSMGGIFGTIPVLLAIIVGYVVSVPLGLVDFTPVAEARGSACRISPPRASMWAPLRSWLLWPSSW